MDRVVPMVAKFPAVYILHCADGTLYTGWTTDWERRLRQHQQGKGARYTRSRRPVRLACLIWCPSKLSAIRAELRIKLMSRAAKLKLIERWEEDCRKVERHV